MFLFAFFFLLAPLAEAHVASSWISLPLVDPEKTHSRGPAPRLRSKRQQWGLEAFTVFLQMQKASQETPLASGCWALLALPPSVLFSLQTNREALPALQPAYCQAGPSYPDLLPADRLPVSGPASPGSATGMVPSFLPRS